MKVLVTVRVKLPPHLESQPAPGTVALIDIGDVLGGQLDNEQVREMLNAGGCVEILIQRHSPRSGS